MTDSVSAPRIPYGAWSSPITAADVAKGQVLISYPMVTGTDVWWQEGRPDEGGRVTVVCRDGAGQQRDMLPVPWNARSRVHEYGGRAYLPVPGRPGDGKSEAAGRAVVFVNYEDQRLYLAAEPGNAKRKNAESAAEAAAPTPLTPREPPAGDGALTRPARRRGAAARTRRPACALRFADLTLSPDGREVWGVQERHEGGKITRSIVAVPLDGSAADDPAAIRELVSGPDFFAFPTLSPDGSRLAWICWNHPRMPWDGTELRVAQISDGVLGRGRLVKGGMRESVLAPVWRDETSLYVVSDWPGWWNIYQVGLVGEPAQRCTRPRRSSPSRCGSWAAGRTRRWATGGWPCCTARAGCGWACSTRRPASWPTSTSRSRSSRRACPRTATRSSRWPADRRPRCRWSGSTRPPARRRCCARRPRRSPGPGTCRCRARSGWRAITAATSTRWCTRRRTRTRWPRTGNARRTSCGRTAARPPTWPACSTWRRPTSPAGVSALSTWTTGVRPGTAAVTGSGCACSGAWWTWRTRWPPRWPWPARARPTRTASGSGARRRAAGRRWPRSPRTRPGAGCSARRRPTSGWLTCASSRPRRTTSSRITWTAWSARCPGSSTCTRKGPRPATWPTAPARCCCSRGSTTRSCRPGRPRASRPSWPPTASGMPCSRSRASRMASAARRRLSRRWRQNCRSTGRCSASPRRGSRSCPWPSPGRRPRPRWRPRRARARRARARARARRARAWGAAGARAGRLLGRPPRGLGMRLGRKGPGRRPGGGGQGRRPGRGPGRGSRGLRRRSGGTRPRGPARPPRWPTPRADRRSAGELGGAGFPDDRDPDLARVGEFLFHLLGHVPRDHLGLDIVHPLRLDHDPDLPARLHGEHLLHPGLGGGDLLQPLQPLHVGLQRLAPGAGPAAADRVRGLGEHGLDRADLDLVVVSLDRVHHIRGLAVAPCDLRADQGVAALDLVGQGLAHVVQHRATFQQHGVHSELAGHHAGDVRGLDQVAEHVLAIGGAVTEPAEQGDQLGVQVGDGELHQRVLTRAHAQLLYLALAALVRFLDPLRMDPAVEDEPFQGEPPDLTAHRVEAGQQHRFGRVVDDEVDPGDGLEGADVPAFPADDPALHLVARKVQHGDDRLAGLLAGHPLDGQGHDPPGPFLAVPARRVLGLPDQQRRLALGLVLDTRDQFRLGLIGGQAGGLLQDLAAFLIQPVQVSPPGFQVTTDLVQACGAFLQLAELSVQAGFPFGQPVLHGAQDRRATPGPRPGPRAVHLRRPGWPGRPCRRPALLGAWWRRHRLRPGLDLTGLPAGFLQRSLGRGRGLHGGGRGPRGGYLGAGWLCGGGLRAADPVRPASARPASGAASLRAASLRAGWLRPSRFRTASLRTASLRAGWLRAGWLGRGRRQPGRLVAARQPAQHDDQREHGRQQPDSPDNERDCAAHGTPQSCSPAPAPGSGARGKPCSEGSCPPSACRGVAADRTTDSRPGARLQSARTGSRRRGPGQAGPRRLARAGPDAPSPVRPGGPGPPGSAKPSRHRRAVPAHAQTRPGWPPGRAQGGQRRPEHSRPFVESART